MDYDGLTIAQLLKSAPWGVRQDFYAQVLQSKKTSLGQDTININKYK